MTHGRRAIGTAVIAAAVVIVIVVGALGAVILSSQSFQPFQKTVTHTSSIPSTYSTGPSVSYSAVSADDLRLQVTLNSSSIGPQGEVAAQVEVLNLQGRNVTMSVVPNQNISGWNGDDFFCSENPSHSIVGFALFGGRFTAGNLSEAGTPLQLAGS